jgi:hypothetical protein
MYSASISPTKGIALPARRQKKLFTTQGAEITEKDGLAKKLTLYPKPLALQAAKKLNHIILIPLLLDI